MGGRPAGVRWLWACLCLWGALAVPAAGQPQAVLRADTTRISLGDPLLLTLSLSYGADERPLPLEPGILEDMGLEALGTAPPQEEDGVAVERRRYRLRVFDPDFEAVPALRVAFVAAGGDTLYRSTAPLAIEIVRVREEGDVELRDVKPPMRLPGGVPLWLAVAAALLVVGGLVGAWLYWRRSNRQAPAAPPPPPVDFVAEFARIAAAGLVEEGRLKEYYTLVSDTLRRFIEVHFSVEALERTSGEIDGLLRRAGVEGAPRARIAALLAEADLVKFARFNPDRDQARRAAEEGGGLVADCLAARAKAEAEAERAAQAEKAEKAEKTRG